MRPKQPPLNPNERGGGRYRRASLSAVPRDYLNRSELLTLVPLSMSTIDKLEKAGIFPSRFVLTPTIRVAWKRREVIRFLEQRAAKRRHAARGATDQTADDPN